MYYSPFGNAHQYATQPGARFRDQPNPDYVAGTENRAELIDWINDEADLDNEASLVTVDAMLRGALAGDTD